MEDIEKAIESVYDRLRAAQQENDLLYREITKIKLEAEGLEEDYEEACDIAKYWKNRYYTLRDAVENLVHVADDAANKMNETDAGGAA